MKTANVFISNNLVHWFSEVPAPTNKKLHLPGKIGFMEEALLSFDDILAHHKEFNAQKINLILDHHFLSCYQFSLPCSNRRKINKMLEYVLDDAVLTEIEDYYYDFFSSSNQERTLTRVSVYAVQKEFVHKLLHIIKKYGFEIHWILSNINLIEIKFRSGHSPNNLVYIVLEEDEARFIVYHENFPITFSVVHQQASQTPHQYSKESLQPFLDAINHQITLIGVEGEQIDEIVISSEAKKKFQVNDQMQLEFADNFQTGLSGRLELSTIIEFAMKSHGQRINLYKSNLLILKEFKKNLKSLIVICSMLTLSFCFFLGSVIYDMSENGDYYEELSQEYNLLVDKYLEKGTSRTNAILLLKQKINENKQNTLSNQQYSLREYKVSHLINNISQLKQTIPSLLLDRFSYNSKSISLKGKIDSITALEELKEKMEDSFPDQKYLIKTSHRSLGDENIEYSVIIRIR